MSRSTSLHNTISQIPSAADIEAEHQISLLDHTKPAGYSTPPNDVQTGDAERGDSIPASTLTDPALFKRIASNPLSLQNSVKQQYAKQKYSKYDRKRYECDDDTNGTPDAIGKGSARPGNIVSHDSILDRAGAKAKGLMKRKKGLGRGTNGGDTIIDVLYENQRGFFFFGMPRYSASSLLPSDPNAWQNAEFRSSPVDIRNAQVPDPSWEWAWKSWYVDMSRDVDEEGWEYSLLFKNGFNWHGNHPWFHSFVRRRRWLRMRKRRDLSHHVTSEKAHELTADYFTIHPKTIKPISEDQSKLKISELARLKAVKDEDPAIENMEITDIASLIRALRKSTVDREKLLAVRKFIAEGGEELYYLSKRMSDIMAVFVYQSSRRHLLSDLINNYDSATQTTSELKKHNHDSNDVAQNDHDVAVRHAQNLLDAVRAAEEQVKRLEYWSDIKVVENESHYENASPPNGKGHPEPSFKSKQKAHEPSNKLHAHPEHTTNDMQKPSFETGSSSNPSKKSSFWYDDNQARPSQDSSDGNDLERYITANESTGSLSSPEIRPKSGRGKGRLRNFDGADENTDAFRSDGETDNGGDTTPRA
ncbi:meiotically up-regulated protein [Acrodontium crateriforme]|uniref:Meiotically up-regulated protein n=1 Tax=Acrodontium crateriforme TaxID=150365 RepID=A0AAQ3R4X7_9PEZI|nr:meiotically up-regulated protein [Acrodontium crateriforme]